jgi:hypothetical protein
MSHFMQLEATFPVTANASYTARHSHARGPQHRAGPWTPSTKGLRHVLWRKNTKLSGQTLTDVNFPMSVARKNFSAKTRAARRTVESALLERRHRDFSNAVGRSTVKGPWLEKSGQ